MGCWQETCFITRAPIHIGNAVTMVVIGRDCIRHELLQCSDLHKRVEQIKQGFYDDYGWLTNLTEAHSKGMMERPESYQRSIFVHQAVWDALQVMKVSEEDSWWFGHGRQCMLREREDDVARRERLGQEPWKLEFFSQLEQLYKVLWFCNQCRLDPTAGLAFKGSQTSNAELYQELLGLQQLALKNWLVWEAQKDWP